MGDEEQSSELGRKTTLKIAADVSDLAGGARWGTQYFGAYCNIKHINIFVYFQKGLWGPRFIMKGDVHVAVLSYDGIKNCMLYYIIPTQEFPLRPIPLHWWHQGELQDERLGARKNIEGVPLDAN